jgi:hypothetical protein
MMIGDTTKIFIRTTFNNDVGVSIDVKNEFKIIFE